MHAEKAGERLDFGVPAPERLHFRVSGGVLGRVQANKFGQVLINVTTRTQKQLRTTMDPLRAMRSSLRTKYFNFLLKTQIRKQRGPFRSTIGANQISSKYNVECKSIIIFGEHCQTTSYVYNSCSYA